MVAHEITKEIFTSFTGTLLALVSAGIIWFLKSAYEKHRSEVLALARFERIYITNLTLLNDNFEFMDQWIESAKNQRPFSFHFEDLLTNEEETYKLSSLTLINKIVPLNYQLKRTNADINNLYSNYTKVIFSIDKIEDDERKQRNLEAMHQNLIPVLEQMKNNKEPVANNLIDTIATIRVASNVRFHSLFGYIALLFRDIFPTINKVSIKKQTELLQDQIKERMEQGQKADQP